MDTSGHLRKKKEFSEHVEGVPGSRGWVEENRVRRSSVGSRRASARHDPRGGLTDEGPPSLVQSTKRTMSIKPFTWYESKPFPKGATLETNPPLSALDATYERRKAAFSRGSVEVHGGRKLAYVVEGDVDAPVKVLALHGTMSGKEAMIPPEPLEGVRLVLLDSAGCGDSDVVRWQEYDLKAQIADVEAVADALFGAGAPFAVVGYSTGGSTALRVAAALGSRVTACGALAANTDSLHSRVTPQQYKASFQPAAKSVHSGCFGGAFLRWVIKVAMGNSRKKTHKDIFQGLSYMIKREKPSAERLEAFLSDTFHVSAFIDGGHCGYHDANNMFAGCKHNIVSWEQAGMDITRITCPTVIFSGRLDATCKPGCGEVNSQLIPGAVITWFDGDTHTTVAQHYVECLKETISAAQKTAT